ncbi:hypothetical protein LguiA_020290 [Lonicera macranthoides]
MVTAHSTTIPSSFIPPNLQKQSTPVQASLSVYSAANSDQEMNCHGNRRASHLQNSFIDTTRCTMPFIGVLSRSEGHPTESGFLLQNRPENHPTAFSHQNTLLPNSFPTPFQSSTIVQTIAAIPVSTNLPFTATTGTSDAHGSRPPFLKPTICLRLGKLADDEPFQSWEARADAQFAATTAKNENTECCIQFKRDGNSSILNQNFPPLKEDSSTILNSHGNKSSHSINTSSLGGSEYAPSPLKTRA